MFSFLFNQNQASRLFRPLAFDKANDLFLCDDDTLAFSYICNPVSGWDTQMVSTVQLMLNDPYPVNSTMQFALWANPDIKPFLAASERLRLKCKDELMRASHNAHLGFLWGGTQQPVETVQSTKVRNFQLIVTFKMPISSLDGSAEDVEKILIIRRKMEERLKKAHLAPVRMNNHRYLGLLDTMLHWTPDAEWRNTTEIKACENTPLNEQVCQQDTSVEKHRHGVVINNGEHKTYVNMLTARRFPKETFAGAAFGWFGDIFDGNGCVTQNFLITLNMSFPEHSAVKGAVQAKKARYIRNSVSALTSFAPLIQDIKDDLDEMESALRKDNRAVKVALNAAVFGQSETEAEDGLTALQGYMQQAGVTMMKEDSFSIPSFITSLPFGTCEKAINQSQRYFTMTTKHAIPLLPMFSEWKGTKTPALQFVSRSGQIMNFDLFDSQTNYNLLIYAESGAGKSFLTNEIIRSYLSMGHKAWAIDAGESYKKLSKSFDGNYTAFNEDNTLSINPFTMIPENDPDAFRDSLEMLAGCIVAMAFTREAPSDLQHSEIERILTLVWEEKGRDALIDDVASLCIEQEDARVRDIGIQLFAFTTKGQFGRYFDKPHNIEFKGDFNVLELDGLDKTPRLQAVVLFMLMVQISHALYEEFKDDRSIKRLVIIDEAWDLLGNSPAVTAFMEKAFRRVRKYNGAGCIVTQSIKDLQKSEAAKAIAENAANSLILKQKDSTISDAAESNQMSLPPAAYRLLKRVTTESGHYSEIFFSSNVGMGIGRLIVDPMRVMMFSTNPADNKAIDDEVATGLSVEDAMMSVVKQRNMLRYNIDKPSYLSAYMRSIEAKDAAQAMLSLNSESKVTKMNRRATDIKPENIEVARAANE
ncbi:type IV secretion system protein TraC [Vibrio mediterranei]|uniref:type IV secretion system protein TraC n=1 Tax=Vibrio mediterranei TaxID=689 RepID=UPI0040683EC6